MKKIILLVLVTMMTSLSFAKSQAVEQVYADSKNGVGQVYTDSKDGIKTLYTDLKSLSPDIKLGINKIAEALKSISTNTWDILVRQQRVWSICFLFVTLSALFLWWKFFKQYEIMKTDVTSYGEIKTANIFLTIIILVLAVVDSAVSAANFESMMTGFLNPEFGALRTVIEFVVKLK